MRDLIACTLANVSGFGTVSLIRPFDIISILHTEKSKARATKNYCLSIYIKLMFGKKNL